MNKDYVFEGSRYRISVIGCEDGDIILSIQNFPLSFTAYLHMEDAERLCQEIGAAVDEAHKIKTKEPA